MEENSFKLLPRPIVTVSKFFGVFPIDVETFKYSRLNLLFTVCQSVLSLLLLKFIYDFDDSLLDDPLYDFSLKMLFIYAISLANISSKYTCIFKFKKYLKSLYFEMKASNTLLRGAYGFNADKSIHLLSLYALFAFGVAEVPVTVIRLVNAMLSRIKARAVVFYACIYWKNFTVCCTELQFIFIVINLYFQFRQINTALEDILAKIDKIKCSYSRNVLNPNEFNMSSTINHADQGTMAGSDQASDGIYTQDNRRTMARRHYYGMRDAHLISRNGAISNHVYGATDFSQEILNLRTAHVHLSEAINLLNKIFGLQLLLSVNLCFCCSLLNINYEIFGFFVEQCKSIPFAVWMRAMELLFRFIILIVIANRTCLEAKCAGTLITSMADRCLSKDTREELQIFFTHMRSYEFEFNACGFFALNMGLVMSAIATGTTYLVILLQFQPLDGSGTKGDKQN